MIKPVTHSVRVTCAILTGLALQACGTSYAISQPRLRVSDFFGMPGGITYLNPDDLGDHCYTKCNTEKIGMVYTQNAGFFDIGHVREGADRTRYIADLLYQNLARSKKTFQFTMIEQSYYYLTITYPKQWQALPKDEKGFIAREAAIRYGQYLGHQSLIWHELLTWFGYSSIGLFPEQISSFSWEDPYSDVMGTCLAVEAMRYYNQADYDEQITRLLAEKIRELKGQPASVGEKAGQIVRGKWYTGDYYFFVTMKKRSFDVGFDDGQVTPWLVPGLFPKATPQDCPAPRPDCIDDLGFQIVVELEPRVFEALKIYKALNLDPDKDKLRPEVHFPMLLDYIVKQAQAQYGTDVDKPTL